MVLIFSPQLYHINFGIGCVSLFGCISYCVANWSVPKSATMVVYDVVMPGIAVHRCILWELGLWDIHWNYDINDLPFSHCELGPFVGCPGFSCCQVWIHKKFGGCCRLSKFYYLCWDAHGCHWSFLCFPLQGVCWCKYRSLSWSDKQPCTCIEIEWLLSWYSSSGEFYVCVHVLDHNKSKRSCYMVNIKPKKNTAWVLRFSWSTMKQQFLLWTPIKLNNIQRLVWTLDLDF